MEPGGERERWGDLKVENNARIKCKFNEEPPGYAMGALSISGEFIETPLTKGMLCLRNITTHDEIWLTPTKIEELSNTRAVFGGEHKLNSVHISYQITIETPPEIQAVRLLYEFSVDKNLLDYEVCLQYHTEYSYQWKAHIYPWAEDSKWVERERLDNIGIPSVFLYREDRSLGILWGIDPNFDYLNPTTWTKDFGLFFIDGVKPAQFRVGAGKLKEGIKYQCPMQIVISDQNHPDAMIKDLMENWIHLNKFQVNPLHVRSNDEALHLFIEGRRESKAAWIPGKGYSLHGERHTFLYFGVQGMAAYFDYLLYEMTGDPLWKERAFTQMDFIVQGQNRDLNDFNYGAIHTTYQLEQLDDYGPHGPGFNSDDRFNIGYKPDVCTLLVRYMLLMWKRVKEHEGIDHKDWYETAILAANWIIRQQNNDGGLPQKVQAKPLEMRWMDEKHNLVIQPFKSRSSTSGRALPSFDVIQEITGESKYKLFLNKLEDYTLRCVQNQYYFTGHHPDLPPYELEEASIWGVAEYWLNRYDESGDKTYLRHAEANAYLALTWWCPKDLSWVNNPTQGGTAEQQHFQQYSVYNYQNRKVEGLWRLYQATGNHLFLQLFDRVLQNIYFTQEIEGGNKGGTYERIADPWLVRTETSKGVNFNSMGVNYTNEQALDCFLQVLELFRMGKSLYLDKYLIHKIYPDGTCFYSRDISSMLKIPFEIIPSMGTIALTVRKWERDQKEWMIFDSTEEMVTLAHQMDHLSPGVKHEVILGGESIGIYQATPDGKLSFTFSGNFSEEKVIIIRELS